MKRILYIDDEAESEKMKSRFELIEIAGFLVNAVSEIKNAINIIDKENSKIDLIILDIIIPPENYYSLEETNGGTTTGLRLLEDIRKINKSVPVIIVSIKRTENCEMIKTKYGVSEYLEKPIDTAEIINAIRRVIN